MFIKNIHVSLFSIKWCLENGPGKSVFENVFVKYTKYKYKYKYMVWNLIKYKYKYAVFVFVFVFVFANTNTHLTPALLMVHWNPNSVTLLGHFANMDQL